MDSTPKRLQSLSGHFQPAAQALRSSQGQLQMSGKSSGRVGKAKPKGNFVDAWSYLGMDEFVSPTGMVIKKKVEEFATRLNPTLHPYTEKAEFPFHVIPEIAELGIVGADQPISEGGKGLGCVDVGSFMYELARKDASIATFYVLHQSLSTYLVHKLAQDELKMRIFKDTIPLRKVMAFALTEPDHGSDASSIQTTAKKVEGGYLLTGKKRWIGNGTFADYILTWARNENDGGRVQCFLVKKGSTGLSTFKMERKMALRAVQNADIVMENVFVPDADRFEKARDFASGTNEVLKHSRIFVAWMAAGMAAGACEAAFEYTKARIQFKKPVAGFQLIQAKLVRMVALTQQSILLCMQISRMYDQDKSKMTIGRIAMTKAECTRNCREVAQLAREAMGGNGIQLENQAMKVLGDIEAIHTYEGSHEVNTLVAGREMTGLAAFK